MKRFAVILLVLSVSVFARAQDSLNVSKVKEFAYGSSYSGIDVVGDYAYLTCGSAGLRIIDISDPEEPIEVGQCDTPGTAVRVAVQGNYAYVLDSFVRIIDVSNPAEPFLAATFHRLALDVVVSGQYAYFAMYPGVCILDLSTPTDPEIIGSATCQTAHVAVAEPYFYVWSGSEGNGSILRCFDAQDPANPVEMGNYESSAYIYDVAVSGSFAYLCLLEDSLSIVDFSDAANPIDAGSAAVFPGEYYQLRHIEVAGNLAYLGGFNSIVVFDISDPQDPNQIRQQRNLGDLILGMSVVNSLVCFSTERGLMIVDTEPNTPDELGYYSAPWSALAVMLHEDYALVAAQIGGLRIVDVSNPAGAFEANYVGGDLWDGVIVGDVAYLNGWGYVYVVNISDPLDLVWEGFWYNSNLAEAIAVQGDYAYLAETRDGLQILDVSDSSDPVSVTVDSGFDCVHDVAVQDSFAYVADGAAGLVVVDVSDPVNPIHLGSYVTPGTALGVAVSGDYAFVADSTAGLRVVDVSEPNAPVEIGACEELQGSASDVMLDGIHAYVACGNDGFYVVDISDPSLPAVIGYYDTPGYTRHVTAADGYAYVADYLYFGIYDVSAALGTSPQPELVAGSFGLLSAYPNPFNAETTIEFEVALPGPVRLAVYDVTGRLVRNLIDQRMTAGRHAIAWEPSGLASGIYFARLESNGSQRMQKLVILR